MRPPATLVGPAMMMLVTGALAQRNIRVLWCGNSLTGVNDLPGLFDRLTLSGPSVIRSSSSESVEGGAQFRQHAVPPSQYNSTSTGLRTISMIRGGGWDYVVLQDQSGSWFNLRPCVNGSTDCLDHYGEYNVTTGRYDVYPEILVRESRAVMAEPVFFMNWRQRYAPMGPTTQAEVAAAYSNVAGLTHAMCAPFGNAMLLNYEVYGNATYAGDEIHPSLMTQYTNACVMYATVTGRTPVGLSDAGTGLNATYNVTLLQENAWRAYTYWKAAELAQCSVSRCVQFVNGNGTLLPLPTAAPTSGGPPVPTIRRCRLPSNASNVHLVGSAILPTAVFPQMQLAPRLAGVCSAGWIPCYRSAADGWGATAFASGCANRGPTLVLIRSTVNRIFGGLAPVSWGGATNQPGLGGWLFRLPEGGGAAQFVDLAIAGQPRSSIMYNDPASCVWLGKWDDLHLSPGCRQGVTLAYSGPTRCYVGATCTNCSGASACYNDTWLAGAAAFNSSAVEVFYSPQLSLRAECTPPSYQCSSGACIDFSMVCDSYTDCSDGGDERGCGHQPTDAPTSSAPTSDAPTTLAPRTFAPTPLVAAGSPTSLAPSTAAPTTLAPVTPAPTPRPISGSPTATVTAYPTLLPPSAAPTAAPSTRSPTTIRWPTSSPPTHPQPTAQPTWWPTPASRPPTTTRDGTVSAAPTAVVPIASTSARVELVVGFPRPAAGLSSADAQALQTTVATVAVADAGDPTITTGSIQSLGVETAADGMVQVVIRFLPNVSASIIQRIAADMNARPFSVRLASGMLRPTTVTTRAVAPSPSGSEAAGGAPSTRYPVIIGGVCAALCVVALVGVLTYKKRATAGRARVPGATKHRGRKAVYAEFQNDVYDASTDA